MPDTCSSSECRSSHGVSLQKNEANSGLKELVRIPSPPTPLQATIPSVRLSTCSTCLTTPSVRSSEEDAAANTWAAGEADVVLLGVKPVGIAELAREISPALREGTVVASVAAAISLDTIQSALPAGTAVVRTMPNTPLAVGAGAVGLSRGANASDADVARALARIGADWVGELEDGWDTKVGSGGHPLTGAQEQQLALARVLIADPHTIILDEATSAMDPGIARGLEAALAATVEGRTVIAIAHRLYTAYDADRIAVVDDGRIVELGSHRELVAAGGPYARLWELWRDEGTGSRPPSP